MYIQEVLKILGVNYGTVRYWVKIGRIRTSKGLTSNKCIYWDDDVWALVGRKVVRDHRVVAYCRVDGTTEKKADVMQLQQQKISLFAAAKGVSLDSVYEDWAPGTAFSPKERPGLHAMLIDIIQGKIEMVIVETHDRLARIGWELFHALFAYYGVELVIMNRAIKLPEYQEEQERDLQRILQRAGIERIDALAADLKPKPKKSPKRKGDGLSETEDGGETGDEGIRRVAPYWKDADPDLLGDLM
jgi:predicted site-specific integrase-resolvase